MSASDLKIAEATWDNFDLDLARRVAWVSFPLIGATASLRLPENHNLTTYIHACLKERIAAASIPNDSTALRGCALVCGDMAAERHFFELKSFVSFNHVDGFDLSGESLKKVNLVDVEFFPHQTDCNELHLAPAMYDLVVGHQGLHHIQNLKNLFEQISVALKPGGLFFLSEWIGPDYLQIPLINKYISIFLLYLLFPSKRPRTTHMGLTKGIGFLQYGKDAFDPSEACNSKNLEGLLLERFRYLRHVHFGGLCYPMFEGNAIHLNEQDAWTTRKVSLVIRLEKILTKLKVIKPLFLVAICEKK